jgi:hypothetical protein
MVHSLDSMDNETQELVLANTILYMREYQHLHNIKKQCITNTQFVYDILSLRYGTDRIKATAVIVIGEDEQGRNYICDGHMVILFDETIIDPSYELYSLKNKKYFSTIANYKSYISYAQDETEKYKNTIKQHLTFRKLAEEINSGGFVIVDKTYYIQLTDYIDKQITEMIEHGKFLKTFDEI